MRVRLGATADCRPTAIGGQTLRPGRTSGPGCLSRPLSRIQRRPQRHRPWATISRAQHHFVATVLYHIKRPVLLWLCSSRSRYVLAGKLTINCQFGHAHKRLCGSACARAAESDRIWEIFGQLSASMMRRRTSGFSL